VVCSDPGADVNDTRLVARAVYVDTADDVAFWHRKDGVGETHTLVEVLRVPTQVVKVGLQGHTGRRRPGAADEAGSGPNVGDAGTPGGMVGGIVLRTERLQAEAVGGRWFRNGEARGDQGLIVIV